MSSILYLMRYRICDSKEISEGHMTVFEIDRKDILVGRKNTRLFACNNSCPHRGASLSKGQLEGESIVCYMHGYEYNILDGSLVTMKSWKKEPSWIEQSPEWRKSGQLILYRIFENEKGVFIEIPKS
ncbi:MAG TPA: Rieske (2Fe-2S) protein [Nitrososphaeraceae archaeon]